MQKGFLVIDMQRNTAILPYDDPFFREYFMVDRFKSSIRKHKTLSELDKDIREYLKNGYLEGNDNEN